MLIFQFPVLSLPSIGVKRPQDYNETSNRECKHLSSATHFNISHSNNVVKIDLPFLCGIPWQLNINKEISLGKGKGALGITGQLGWGGMELKALIRTWLMRYLKYLAPNRSATLTNMQSVVSHHRNYQRS